MENNKILGEIITQVDYVLENVILHRQTTGRRANAHKNIQKMVLYRGEAYINNYLIKMSVIDESILMTELSKYVVNYKPQKVSMSNLKNRTDLRSKTLPSFFTSVLKIEANKAKVVLNNGNVLESLNYEIECKCSDISGIVINESLFYLDKSLRSERWLRFQVMSASNTARVTLK